MNRLQAEALAFRLRKPEDRFTTPHGASGIIYRNADEVTEFIRNADERVPLHRLSDEELRLLLPDHVRDEFNGIDNAVVMLDGDNFRKMKEYNA